MQAVTRPARFSFWVAGVAVCLAIFLPIQPAQASGTSASTPPATCLQRWAITPAFAAATANTLEKSITAQGCLARISVTSPTQAVLAVLDGKADAAGLWSPLAEARRALARTDTETLSETLLWPVALVALVPAANPVRAVSDGYVREWLKGTLTSWEPMTGQNMPIIWIDGDSSGETLSMLRRQYLGGFAPAQQPQRTPNTHQALKATAQTRNALGFLPGPAAATMPDGLATLSTRQNQSNPCAS